MLLVVNLFWLCVAVGWMPEGGVVRLVTVHLRCPSDPCVSVSLPLVHLRLWKWSRPSGPALRLLGRKVF